MLINLFGADITLQNANGDTPLHSAIHEVKRESAIYLIHRQIDVPIDMGFEPRISHLLIRNVTGDNALHLCIGILIDIDRGENLGPLARNNIQDIVQELLLVLPEHVLNELTTNELTALDLANELDMTNNINANVRAMLINAQVRGTSPMTARLTPTHHFHHIQDR